jgi:hypothetical protein
MGWKPRTPGYEIVLNARGVIESSLLLLIVVLSWPHRRFRDLVARIVLALPLSALLIAIDAPPELLGNFYHALPRNVDPNGFQALFAWDKFLEGGPISSLPSHSPRSLSCAQLPGRTGFPASGHCPGC